MYKIQEYVNIKDYSTMHIGGQFRYFTTISSLVELTSLCAIVHNDVKYENIPIFILGGGSNVLFSDGVIDVLAIKIEIKGFEVINETDEYVDIKIGAGEVWDKIVEKTVNMNLSGLEALSAIPGTVGATPVQNVGAYGSEVKDTILEVEVFDTKEGKIKILSNTDCKFGYRDSIFKNEANGRYIIIAVFYRLNKLKELKKNYSEKVLGFPRQISLEARPDHFQKNFFSALLYPAVKKYFEDLKIENPTLIQIREAIINIRNEKLPNPKEIPNVGSFFKNPIVPKEIANKIKDDFRDAKFFLVDDNLTKIPAGWLIENAGLKGKSFGKVSVYSKNALVLVNTNNATCEDVIEARNEIIKIVEDKFGITLEQEPEII